MPRSPKKDKTTQILRSDPELFDFRSEVEPLLEILVAKSITQAQVELFEEERAREIELKKRNESVLKRINIMKVQKEQFQKDRYDRERRMRISERTQFYLAQKEVYEKVYAREFVKGRIRKGLFRRVHSRLGAKKLVSDFKREDMNVFVNTVVVGRIQMLKNRKDYMNSLVCKIVKEGYRKILEQHKSVIILHRQQQETDRENIERTLRTKELELVLQKQKKEENQRRLKLEIERIEIFTKLNKEREKVRLKDNKQIEGLYAWKQLKTFSREVRLNGRFHFGVLGTGIGIISLLTALSGQKNSIISNSSIALEDKVRKSTDSNVIIEKSTTNKSHKHAKQVDRVVKLNTLSSKYLLESFRTGSSNPTSRNRSSIRNNLSPMKSFQDRIVSKRNLEAEKKPTIEESQILNKTIPILERLMTKWGKIFAGFKFEVPLSQELNSLIQTYEKFLWIFLGVKEEMNQKDNKKSVLEEQPVQLFDQLIEEILKGY